MADELNPQRPQKLSIIVFSGAFDKIHYALVMASAAAAIDTPVTLFFTMEGARALLQPGADGPAWADLPVTGGTGQQFRPGTGSSGPVGSAPPSFGGALDQLFHQRGVADFETLLMACRDLGVRFMVCEMGLKALDMARENLRTDIDFAIGGMVTFLNDAHRDGAVVFV